MLILTRHEGESIKVADGTITFTILLIRGSQVRIGIDAPPEISIDREEIDARKRAGLPKP